MESFKDNIVYSVEFPFLSQEKRCAFPFRTRKEEIGIRNDWDNCGKTDNKLSLKSREPLAVPPLQTAMCEELSSWYNVYLRVALMLMKNVSISILQLPFFDILNLQTNTDLNEVI